MQARFPGFCLKCHKPFPMGTSITKDASTGKYVHVECPKPNPTTDNFTDLLAATILSQVRSIERADVPDEPELPPAPVISHSPITLSHYQQAFLDFVRNGKGHGVGYGVAGCGKTYILVQSLNACPPNSDFALVAFNRRIVATLKQRQEAGLIPQNASIRTLHSLGLKECNDHLGRVQKDDDKVNGFLDNFWPGGRYVYPISTRIGNRIKRGYMRDIVSKCKYTLTDWTNKEAVLSMMERYNIIIEEDEDGNNPTDEILSKLPSVMEFCKTETRTVDYDDMQWLPIVLNWKIHQFDFLLVDEAQDLNACQIKFILKAIKPTGRIIAVGDPRQSIYGFRGADTEAMPRLMRMLNATKLPLSITYRCPKSHVRLAQEIVPEIEAAEDAPEGEIIDIDEDEFTKLVAPGDLVICRTNAPLVEPAYRLIRQGIKAAIQGKDIAGHLVASVDRFQTESIRELLTLMTEYFDREMNSLIDRGKDMAVATVKDTYDTLVSIASECGTDNVEEMRTKMLLLFSDDNTSVMLSSVHRAKGLEAERVFILHPELMPHPKAKQPWEREQEMNCLYVAHTRSKSIMYPVHF